MRRIMPVPLLLLALLVTGRADAAVVAPGCTSATTSRHRVISLERDHDPANVELDSRLIVSPSHVDAADARLAPGESFACTITLRNRYSRRMTFQLAAAGLRGSDDPDVGTEFVDPGSADTAGGWISLAADAVTLAPREVVRIPVVVTVPDEAPDGAAFGAVSIISRTQPIAGQPANVAVQSSVAVPFLLNVGTSAEPRLVLGVARAPHVRTGRAAWTLRTSVTNEGSLHAAPRGRVRIRSIAGSTVAELPVATRPLLPGARARIESTWRRVPWIGVYRYDLRMAARSSTVRTQGWLVTLPPAGWSTAFVAGLCAVLIVRRGRRRWSDDDVDWADEDQG